MFAPLQDIEEKQKEHDKQIANLKDDPKLKGNPGLFLRNCLHLRYYLSYAVYAERASGAHIYALLLLQGENIPPFSMTSRKKSLNSKQISTNTPPPTTGPTATTTTATATTTTTTGRRHSLQHDLQEKVAELEADLKRCKHLNAIQRYGYRYYYYY